MIPGLDCFGNAWVPRIGDPSAFGWAVATGYGLAAGLSALAWRGAMRWSLVTALLLLMLNKQLDLQTGVTAVAKCMALAQGWYGIRRPFQIGFALVVLAGAAMLIRALARRARRGPGEVGPALLGLACLTLFVALRAAQVHHLDRWPGMGSLPVSAVRALEPLGIALIAGHAGVRLWLRGGLSRGSRA